jgi:hypothetical protein
LTSEHRLLENGKQLKILKKSEAFDFFEKAIEFKDYAFHETGNMYSFVEIKSQGKTNRITWASGSTKANRKLIEFHKKLMAITK